MGLVPHCLHLRLPFKSPSLSAIYFTKGDRCFINHCLINHSRIWNELIWTLKTNAGSGPGLDLSSFSFSPWLPRELPCALDMLRVPLKTMCVLLVLGGVSIMSMRASWLIINSSHVYPYWSSVYLSHQFLERDIEISHCNYGFVYFSCEFYQFGCIYLETMLLDA